ncbi:MAG: DUF3857 domain-containing protein [Weeksellaceae bacterium]|nr:DUF3857 domain-containing protein [Weeksellaceae bacterium]
MKKIYGLCFIAWSIFGFSQNYNSGLIPDNLLKNSNAVVRESTEDYVLKSVNDLEIKRKHAVTILNSAGDEFSTVYIPYNPSTKVSNIKVEIYDGAGNLAKSFTKKDFSDYTNNPSAALYVDDRILILSPISGKYPYTVKTSFETNTSNTVYLSSFRPVSSYNIAVQKTSFTVLNSSGIKIRTKITDRPLTKVSHTSEGNLWKYSYENIPSIKEEELAPSIGYLVPQVELSPEKFTLEGRQGDMTDWNTFGKWYYTQLIRPVSEITPEIRAEIASLNLQGTTSDKVKIIYQYMQNKTRYVLIAMGIGGWQPMPASEVSKKGYGDCKALTNYMRTLLEAAGIPSYFSVIYNDSSEMSFDKDFPRLSGNHAILMVPTEKGNIWLENTSQKHAFNHLSYTSHYRNVLAVKESGIEIVDTPKYKPQDSREKMLAKIKLSEDGSIDSEAKFEFSGGQYDTNLGLLGLKNDEVQQALKKRHYNLKIDQLSVQNIKNDRDLGRIIYDMNLKANGFAKKMGNDLFFPVMPYYHSTIYSGNDERKLPFENSFPFQDDYEIEFSIPAGYKFTEIPESRNLSTEFGTYSITFTLKEEKLIVHRVLTINKGLYAKEKFAEYMAFRKKTASSDNTKVLISKL